ncbi:MAG: exodeoxyribonuclease III [Flavobacteriales bacterium]
MKILSYNVNGIRAAVKKGFLDWIQDEAPDMLCLQETKAQVDQIPIEELNALGYEVYAHSAEKKGYSGVAILTKKTPKHVEIGCGIPEIDFEGRVIRADYDDFSLISLYLPSGSSGDLRQAFKMEVLAKFQDYIQNLKAEFPNLIISGDYNICHTAIDIHNPKTNKNTSGFKPEEREWIGNFMSEVGFIDSFRHFHPDSLDHYSWWSYRAGARGKNKGWRIDYHMVSKALESRLSSARILNEVVHSDHCPIEVVLT